MITTAIWLIWAAYSHHAGQQYVSNNNWRAAKDILYSLVLPTIAAVCLTVGINQ